MLLSHFVYILFLIIYFFKLKNGFDKEIYTPPPMHALLPRLGGMLTPVPHSKSILGYGK